MKTYLVSYDLTRPEWRAEYTRLIDRLKTAPDWAKPLDSLWLIKSPLGPAEIVNQLRSVTDRNDKILVIEVTNAWAAYNLSDEIITWMRQGL